MHVVVETASNSPPTPFWRKGAERNETFVFYILTIGVVLRLAELPTDP